MSKLVPFLVAAGLVLAGAPNAVAGAPPLAWEACDPAPLECATAEVPRDYARPDGPKLELALIRYRATDREHRIGSLFVNPGGPGGSGIEMIREAPPAALAAFGRLYDVVGFDPRGVGASRPAVKNCGVQYEGDRFMTPETLDGRAVVRAAHEQLRRCHAASGGILPYLTTANVARDLDRLRAAVGDAKLNYVGISYGALIGETYTTLFPGRTGAFVIDSPVDGEAWLAHPFEAIDEQLVSFEGSLDRFLGWCGRHANICRLDPEDPEDDFDALVARLNATPAPVLSDPAQPPVNGDELLEAFLDGLYTRFMWSPLAAAVAQAQQGDGSAVRELTRATGDESDGTGVFFAYMANEGRYRGGVDRFLRQKEHTYALSDHFWWARGAEWVGLTQWPFRARGVHRGPFRHAPGAQTVLVIGGTHDPATPYKWAKRYVADLGNARLLTYRSDGHGAITDLNPCIVGFVLDYIATGALPPEDASCRQQVLDAAALRAPGPDERLAWKRAMLR